MMTKTKLGFLATLFVLFGLMSAQAQQVVHPKAYYDAITYEWNDDNGVTHTSAATDVATDPNQIIALLKKVYCDPNFPGPTYSAYNKNGNREDSVYYGAVAGGWNISAEDVTPPYEDGYTILMVAVNDNLHLVGNDTRQQTGTNFWGNPTYDTFQSNIFTQPSELLQYIRDNVASVQLLTDGLRIGEGQTQGTAFNISGTYDRFFMLGKGQARKKDSWVIGQENSYDYPILAGERVPFKQMFEQFSPTNGKPDSEITDFYNEMVHGNIYNVIHDCASVIEVEHYFSMAGKTVHQPRSLTGLNIFIPDYRLLYWENQFQYNNWSSATVDGRTLNPYKDVNGNQFRNPGAYNNELYLCAHYGNYHPTYAPCVGIYTINLDADAVDGSAPQTYDVVLNWQSSLDRMSGSAVPQTYIVYIVVTDEDGNEVYTELITTNETNYTYTVPQDEHSYTITYIVYGKPADGEHDFFVAWSNQASVVIPGWNDFLGLTLNHYESDYVMNEETNYYRNFINLANNEDVLNALTPADIESAQHFTLYRYDNAMPDVMLPVAYLTLSPANNNRIRYNVTYDNQEPLAGYNVPITDNGYVNTENNVLQLQDILFVDQFTANTAMNNHPGRYGYVLMMDESDKSTNAVEVPVFKTTSAIDGFYTLDQIMGDVNAELTDGVKNANVTLSLAPNPSVYYYTLHRGSNANPNEKISEMQRRTDGTYLEMLDVLPQYVGAVDEPGLVQRLDNNVIQGEYGDYMTYSPVIWTFGDDRVKKDGENSYGSPILKTGVGEVGATVEGTRATGMYGTFLDPDLQECSIFNPIIKVSGLLPENASVDYEIYMYRVWRLCDDHRCYFISPESGRPHHSNSQVREPVKLIVEEMTDDSEITFGNSNNQLAFGALSNAQIKFKIRMYYKKIGENGMRLETPEYYVVEKVVNWTEIVTGVEEINASNEVSVTYVNAQGIQSDKPFNGVNIVITRYSDGSTRTTKVVR